jgi:isoleucyl-tRNA synthetase
VLEKLGDELRFVLITSYARVHAIDEQGADAVATEVSGLRLAISPSDHAKCPRCWHHREDVGIDSAHPLLCGRCVENVSGSGETRRFA